MLEGQSRALQTRMII